MSLCTFTHLRPPKQQTSSVPLMFGLSRFTSSFPLSRSPLRWAAWSAPLFVSFPVGVNNLTTELLQSWLPSRPQIGTVCLFMTLCGSAHVWDVQEWEEDSVCVCACVCDWVRACVSLLDFSQQQISLQSHKTVAWIEVRKGDVHYKPWFFLQISQCKTGLFNLLFAQRGL